MPEVLNEAEDEIGDGDTDGDTDGEEENDMDRDVGIRCEVGRAAGGCVVRGDTTPVGGGSECTNSRRADNMASASASSLSKRIEA